MSKETNENGIRAPYLDAVDIHSPTAIYIQIENFIRFAIASGELSPGDRIPPVRELAERLDINYNTVTKAYRDLEVMGLLRSRRGKGVFVRDDAPERCKRDVALQVITGLHNIVAEAKAAGISRREVMDAVKVCLQSDAPPYEPLPTDVRKKVDKLIG